MCAMCDVRLRDCVGFCSSSPRQVNEEALAQAHLVDTGLGMCLVTLTKPRKPLETLHTFSVLEYCSILCKEIGNQKKVLERGGPRPGLLSTGAGKGNLMDFGDAQGRVVECLREWCGGWKAAVCNGVVLMGKMNDF